MRIYRRLSDFRAAAALCFLKAFPTVSLAFCHLKFAEQKKESLERKIETIIMSILKLMKNKACLSNPGFSLSFFQGYVLLLFSYKVRKINQIPAVPDTVL